MASWRSVSQVIVVAAIVVTVTGLTVRKTTVEELTATSQIVVHARVGLSTSRWEGNNIYTYTELDVIEQVKGASGETITVKQLGGKVGEDALEVPGSPALRRGEEVVLFLVSWNNAYWIHSIVLGKFAVVRTEGRVEAVNDLNNVGLIDPTTGREITDAAGKRNTVPLDLLKQQVRAHIQR